MLTTEHANTARKFLDNSDQEFLAGDILQGAEKLWGAAAHAVMAVAVERGWSHQSHQSLKKAAIQISREREDLFIEASFATAEKFHRHFYHDSMEDWEREADRPVVREFVRRVLDDHRLST